MPIRPEDRWRYPPDWKVIVARIRERSGGWCEFCQEAQHGQPHPVTGSRVVLTTAHLGTEYVVTVSDDDLAAMCQRCHLKYDETLHAQSRAARVAKRVERIACLAARYELRKAA